MTQLVASQNQTMVIEFLFSVFPPLYEGGLLFFILLILVYAFIISGNLVIFVAVQLDMALHTPMYFFISVLSFLEIPSAQGRQKAFSTCASHLTVVTLFYSTTLFTYARPKLMYAYNSNKVVSVLYTVVVPLLNPIIYCLRNRDVKMALKKTILCNRSGSGGDGDFSS